MHLHEIYFLPQQELITVNTFRRFRAFSFSHGSVLWPRLGRWRARRGARRGGRRRSNAQSFAGATGGLHSKGPDGFDERLQLRPGFADIERDAHQPIVKRLGVERIVYGEMDEDAVGDERPPWRFWKHIER